MSPSANETPRVLMLGFIDHAHAEFDSISELAEVITLTQGNRAGFIGDCRSGVYNGVVAISRTFNSIEITGPFDCELIAALPKSLKTISHNGAGYDQIDVSACTERGIQVSNTPGAVDAATANTAMFLILGALRRAWSILNEAHNGRWRGDSDLGHDPEGKVLGILGMGGIGTAVALRAAGFGMRLQYHNRKPVQGLDQVFPKVLVPTYVGFEELLRSSDIISIHLPLTSGTKRLIGHEQFKMMKDGVVLVNTARGGIIHESALVSALDTGKVWSAGLDVYEDEPRIHPGLLESDKAVLLPHIGTATMETQKNMEILVIENVKSALSTGQLLTRVAEQNAILF